VALLQHDAALFCLDYATPEAVDGKERKVLIRICSNLNRFEISGSVLAS
jgi:hypothetical protein